MRIWDPIAPLPNGITQIEASAGTGKTYAIVDLCVRLIAEDGLRTSELVVVTFTRAATAELKERLRDRITEAVQVLQGRQSAEGHPTLQLLDERKGEERALALRRLRRAAQTFDEVLISTIHGFCQRMLHQHAFESGADLHLELVEDNHALIEDIVQDWKTRLSHSATPEQVQWLERAVFKHITTQFCKNAIGDPEIPVAPVPEAHPQRSLDELRRDWPRLRSDAEARVAEMLDRGGFRPGQRTLGSKHTTKRLGNLEEQLEIAAGLTRLDPGVWSPSKLQGLAAPGFDPLQLELVDRLEAHRDEQSRALSSCLYDFVVQARVEQARAHREHRTQSFSDLIRGLARCVGPDADADQRQALVNAARGRFRAALIDEFQDTDQAQWTIFKTLFSGPNQWLFLIGDPKQAIYSFRGANIDVYLDAGKSAGDRAFTMTRNYRSDADMLEALNLTLHQPGLFGQHQIPYVEVDAPDRPVPRRIRRTDGKDVPPLQFRLLDDPLSEPMKLGEADTCVAAQCGRDILDLLSGDYELYRGSDRWSRLMPGDIAVLVRSGHQAGLVHATLRDLNVPCVISRAGNVFASEAYSTLRLWLSALLDPREGPARSSFCDPVVGVSGDLILQVDDGDLSATETWNGLMEQLRDWRDRAQTRGIHEAALTWIEQMGIRTRLLAQAGGERQLTDLLHLIELLHAEQTRTRMGLAAALAWLDQTRAAPSDDDTYPVRLERDDEAVRITTIHSSKGLEYPVALVPWSWRGRKEESTIWYVAPDERDPTRRTLHVHDDANARQRAELQEAREGTRLLYVALTRSRTLTICHLASAVRFHRSMAAAWLFGSDENRHTEALNSALEPGMLHERLASFGTSPHVLTSNFGTHEPQPWIPPSTAQATLDARTFRRRMLDPTWRQYSYTALTRGRELHTVNDSGPRVGFDADADATQLGEIQSTDRGEPCPLASFPAGAQAGVCMHAIFEHMDFEWANPASLDAPALEALTTEQLRSHGYDPDLAKEVLPGLMSALQAPLGGPLGQTSLAAIRRPDRLDELRFDLMLGDAETRDPSDSPRIIPGAGWADCLRPRADDPCSPITTAYLDSLDGLPNISGTMTGSIDLVFRAEVDGHPRWFIADYKSNVLGRRESLRTASYTDPALREAMAHHHYFLQYHLYLVALHRFLKWRLPNYSIERDLGGAYYLFVRGMVGDTPGQGCFFDAPPPDVIEHLDDLLARKEAHQ